MRSIKSTYNKTRFASKFEAELAKKFDELGIKWEYEPCRIPWQPAVRYYKPDFKVTLPNGEEFLIECKGYFDPSMRSKMAQVREQHPDLDIRFVFMCEDKVVSKSTKNPTTYKRWAERHGYPCWNPDTLAESDSTNVERKTRRTGKHRNTRRSKGSHQGRAQASS